MLRRVAVLVPVLQALGQTRVLVQAACPLHKLLIGAFLYKRPRAQQFQHVRLVQDFILQETLPHLRRR